jgi:hypothetical protein
MNDAYDKNAENCSRENPVLHRALRSKITMMRVAHRAL